MRSNSFFLCVAVISFFFLLLLPTPSSAFYEKTDGKSRVEVRGFLRAGVSVSDNPEADFFYENENDAGMNGEGRLLLSASFARGVSFELNAVQWGAVSTANIYGSGFGQPMGVERSSSLEFFQIEQEKTLSALAIDRVNIRYSGEMVSLTVGRQPVNLATVYYFTPNDFFAPFSASTFYRVYKPGVDSARLEGSFADGLANLTIAYVAGYEIDGDEFSGWGDSFDGSRNSVVAKFSFVALDSEFSLVGGLVRGADVIGASFQGEAIGKIGIRAEGHVSDKDGNSVTEVAGELDRRFKNSLTLRLSYFYHGAGEVSVGDYSLSSGAYLAKKYLAVGAGYEFSPLLSGEALILSNLVDSSYFASVYSVYSLSNESELSVSLSVPFGDKPSAVGVKSEYGFYPVSAGLELRSYF